VAATTGATLSYGVISAQMVQMVLYGVAIGLTSAPATESTMGAISRRKAGVGSAVNDFARLVGGTLGVAVIGSVYASVYRLWFTATVPAAVAGPAAAIAHQSVGAATGCFWWTGEVTAAVQTPIAATSTSTPEIWWSCWPGWTAVRIWWSRQRRAGGDARGRPAAWPIRSLALIQPPAFAAAAGYPAVRAMLARVRTSAALVRDSVSPGTTFAPLPRACRW
jgi:hypothetical protein